METDSLVRIFDKENAPRDEAFCVARDALQGRTPEQLRDYFALSFVPRFICDARIPPGNKITLCSLRNAAGQTVKIYFPRTRLELGNDRPLAQLAAPELSPSLEAPTVPAPPLGSGKAPPREKFNLDEAERFLSYNFPLGGEPLKFAEGSTLRGPDGFPYVQANMDGVADKSERNPNPPDIIQGLLDIGHGLAVFTRESREPTFVYRYRDLLCFKLFGALRPAAAFDETLYAGTVDSPAPVGSETIVSRPGEDILPPYARRTLNQRVSAVLGREIELDPTLVEYPELDGLKRFKLNLDVTGLDATTRNAAGQAAWWCLPYAVFL
jgi:hypothetical protein